MSGRIRTIKPELLEDAVTAGVSHAAFRLYVGAIVLSDDFGNFRAEPRKLLGEVFWARAEVTVETVKTLLSELAEAGRTTTQQGLFGLYRVRGQLYGHIRNWEKHQKVDKIGNPRVPGPDDKEAESCSPSTNLSRESRELLDPDHDLDHDLDPDQERPFGRSPGADAPSLCLVAPESGQNQALPTPESDAVALPVQPELLTTSTPEREVYEHWVDGWKRIVRGVRVPKLDTKRRGKVRARLREGYTVAELKLAVDGVWASTWHVENRRYDLELVCRDAPHVDGFIERAPRAPAWAQRAADPEPPPDDSGVTEAEADAALAAAIADLEEHTSPSAFREPSNGDVPAMCASPEDR